MWRIVGVLLVALVFVGCKGPKGDQGPSTTSVIHQYTGPVPSSGQVSITMPNQNDAVLVYFSANNVAFGLLPIAQSATEASSGTWAMVTYSAQAVYFYNCSGGYYKILVIDPNA